MTPWKWNDKISLWVNSVTDETMTAIEYDDARCRRIAKLESQNATLLKALQDAQLGLTDGWLRDKCNKAIRKAKEK